MAAMDLALTTSPDHVLALCGELIQRGGLESSLRGLGFGAVALLLQFAAANIAFKGQQQTRCCLLLLQSLLNTKEQWLLAHAQTAGELKPLIAKICQRVAFELEQIRRLARTEALVDALLAI
ncbi:WD domain, G-beta repeat-containing protein, putative [Eimeria tenella]|uniref:WD domain, G-beta repeat-containing protein, putative n=1 Tax=Eimeria tenella TaxID=5802 RepID=U6L352_EIMTE|nr:WD domain, G-beta repeat-containing protein, putative [Eimeria tenella]CDJ44591.1 WD domain, G-beta repeat-containing protein, putative [Eimeria tenella]|eukprot:XP_013235339.1 WD domain, G-beta repeat-containing protein, putative [Eimeria tenella]